MQEFYNLGKATYLSEMCKNTSSRYVHNDIEKKVLSQDLKFCINPDKLDYCQTLTPFEKRVRTLKNQLICCNSRRYCSAHSSWLFS